MPLTVVATAPGTSTGVNFCLLNTKPCVSSFASSYSPAIAFVLFPLAAVEIDPGTSMVSKTYCAVAVPGMLSNRPSATVANDLRPMIVTEPLGNDPRQLISETPSEVGRVYQSVIMSLLAVCVGHRALSLPADPWPGQWCDCLTQDNASLATSQPQKSRENFRHQPAGGVRDEGDHVAFPRASARAVPAALVTVDRKSHLAITAADLRASSSARQVAASSGFCQDS